MLLSIFSVLTLISTNDHLDRCIRASRATATVPVLTSRSSYDVASPRGASKSFLITGCLEKHILAANQLAFLLRSGEFVIMLENGSFRKVDKAPSYFENAVVASDNILNVLEVKPVSLVPLPQTGAAQQWLGGWNLPRQSIISVVGRLARKINPGAAAYVSSQKLVDVRVRMASPDAPSITVTALTRSADGDLTVSFAQLSQ